jgi:predicted nucleotidyltransferase component of viral defense system
MLQTQAVNASTLELLKKLMVFKALANFNLLGGTALALQMGHRFSVDLDFFTTTRFEKDELKLKIEAFA